MILVIVNLKEMENQANDNSIDDDFLRQQEELEKLEEELRGDNEQGKRASADFCAEAQREAPAEGQDGGVKPPEENKPDDDPDERSIFVKNVDFSADNAQLSEHFKECGEIVRVTIRKNNQTGNSLG